MRKVKTLLFYIILYYLLLNPKIQAEYKKAVVIVPVADLVGEKIGQLVDPEQVRQIYKQLPFSPDINLKTYCPRIQQILFNEVVEIIKEKGQEIYIRIPHLFYLSPTKNNEPQVNYWTLRENIMELDQIKRHTQDLTKIPLPISFNKSQLNSKNIVTLIEPWFNQKTNQIFSAGTRFVWAEKKKNKTMVHIFNPLIKKYEKTAIPNKKLAIHTNQQTAQQQRTNFIKILRKWVGKNNGFIPYVWGGFSFTKRKTDFYSSLNEKEFLPKTGFDCAGIIARAAQICDIPYFYKNTTTIKQFLFPITNKLLQGDIIWIPGHVMVVADLEKNTLIEARGYNHGYGKIHEIHLHEEFKGINTYKDLIDAYHNKKTITRLDYDGNEQEKIKNFTLLRLIN